MSELPIVERLDNIDRENLRSRDTDSIDDAIDLIRELVEALERLAKHCNDMEIKRTDNGMEKLDQNGHAQAQVFERKGEPGVWSVEWIDEDGGIEQAIFIGPDAEERAREYASFRYGC